MDAQAKFASPILGSFTVGEAGVTWNDVFYAFGPISEQGFSRTDLAALAGLHPRSIKRIEKRSQALATGRRSINRRVLFYAVDAVIAFFGEKQQRIDLLAAISLGFPLEAVRPDRFGFRASASRAFQPKSNVLLPFPVGLAQQATAAWENWRAIYHEENSRASALPLIRNPALEPHTAFALAAFADATLPRTKLADWARTCGHSSKHIEYQVAEIARILRERLNTTEGQLLLALLFRSKEVPITQRAEPILHRPDLDHSEKNGFRLNAGNQTAAQELPENAPAHSDGFGLKARLVSG